MELLLKMMEDKLRCLKNIFQKHIINFLNELEYNDHKYQQNGTINNKNKEKFISPLRKFVSFEKYRIYMFFM